MKQTRRPFIAGLLLSPVLVLANATVVGQSARTAPTRPPSKFPPRVGAPPLKYAGPEEGYPPRIVGIQDIRPVPSRPVARRLTDSVALAARAAAAADGGARTKLGPRFIHVTTASLEDTKHADADAELTRVLFFSYSQKAAVEVQLRGNTVTRVLPRPGYSPPLGHEEAMEAVSLARQDGRIRNQIQGLIPRTIQSGAHPSPQRVARVSFAANEAADPTFVALVDLIDRKVLFAGPVPTKP